MLRWNCEYNPQEDWYEVIARWYWQDEEFYVACCWHPTRSEFSFAEIVKEMQVQVVSFDPTRRLLQ